MRPLAALFVLAAGCAAHDQDRRPSERAPPEHPPATLAAAPTEPARVEPAIVRVLVAGDVMPHRPVLADPAQVGGALAPLAPLFSSADAAIVNFEAATGDAARLRVPAMGLAAEPQWMGALKEAHVSALTVANNHACDLGPEGLAATLEAARTFGLPAIGADPADPFAPRVVAEKSGKRVCAVAWTTFANQRGCGASLAIAARRRADDTRIGPAILRARASGCDAVIAIVHGGQEYAPQIILPRRQARAAAEAGADAIVMHHPHVPSELRTLTTQDGREVPVFLSVGNLVSNQGDAWNLGLPPTDADRRRVSRNAWTRLGVVADLVFTFDGGPSSPSARRTSWGYHLTWTENTFATRRTAPPEPARVATRLVDPERDRMLLARLSTDERGPVRLLSGPCLLSLRPSHCN